jgi:predicted RNA binding protein YcfA (HicA-like mRNA interferase family)
VRLLREHDKRFLVFENKGKGSHRMLFHPDIDGQPRSIPIPWHKGHDVSLGVLRSIIRRFNLPRRIFG